MQDPRTFWDQRYGEAGFAYGEAPNDFLRERADAIPAGGKVLCLAEGEGRNAVFLARRGLDVTAIDLSAVGLAKARALAERHGVSITTEACDLAELTIEPGAWDAIVCIWMHLPAPLRARVHRAAADGLAPGGVLVLEAYTPAQLALGTGGPKDASMLVDPDALRDELSSLSLEHFAAHERDVQEGAFHSGRSAVVQVVARRR